MAAEAAAEVTPISPVVPRSSRSSLVSPISLVEPLAPAPPGRPGPAAPVAPVVAPWVPPTFVGRPAVVDADLRPVMVDKLAGDLADLTRVLLGVTSSVPSPTVTPAEPGPVLPARAHPHRRHPQGDLTPIDVSPEAPSFAPAPERRTTRAARPSTRSHR